MENVFVLFVQRTVLGFGNASWDGLLAFVSRKLLHFYEKSTTRPAKTTREPRPFVDEAFINAFGTIPKVCDSRKQATEKSGSVEG